VVASVTVPVMRPVVAAKYELGKMIRQIEMLIKNLRNALLIFIYSLPINLLLRYW